MGTKEIVGLVGFALVGVGLLLALIGTIVMAVSSRRSGSRTAQATGQIVGLQPGMDTGWHGSVTSNSGSYYLYPVVEFTDMYGVTHRRMQHLSTGNDYAVGQVVPVAYDPGDPEGNFVIARDSKGGKVASVILICMGIIFAITGLCVPFLV